MAGFGSMAPGMPKPKGAKPKKPHKFKPPSMAYRGVSQQPMPPKPSSDDPPGASYHAMLDGPAASGDEP